MSRAPSQKQPDQPVGVAWFDLDPPSYPVLTTTNPIGDGGGKPARWYARRQFIHGRWERVACWVDPVDLIPLQPQPSHWRPDPARGLLEVPVV